MMSTDSIYFVIDDDGNLQDASYDRHTVEDKCENHNYEMREQAIDALGQDGDCNEKDLQDAEIYAGQEYPIWAVGKISKTACIDADGEDLIVYVDGLGDVEVNSGEILDLLDSVGDE